MSSAPDHRLRLVHHHPGRVRVRADAFLSVSNHFNLLQPLQSEAGILRLEHRPLTGSVVVEYDPEVVDSNALLERLVALGGFSGIVDEAYDKSSRREPGEVVVAAMRGLNGAALALTQERADLRSLVPGALAGAAALSFAMHDPSSRMPRWDNLLYWSYAVFIQWHMGQIQKPPGSEPEEP